MNDQFTEQDKSTWQKLTSVVGKKVTSIYVNSYLFQTERRLDDTPLQLNFSDSTIIYLDGESDGESLRVTMAAWHDPFSGKVDLENTLYIQQFGNWVQDNMSDTHPFDQVVGKVIEETLPIINQFGKLSGVQFVIDEVILNFEVNFDECHIVWGELLPKQWMKRKQVVQVEHSSNIIHGHLITEAKYLSLTKRVSL